MRHKVNTPVSTLVVLLRAAAVVQIVMVAVNLSLVHVLGLHDRLTRWPAVRELFAVHLLCISLMVLTLGFDDVWMGRPHRLPALAFRFQRQRAAPSQTPEMR